MAVRKNTICVRSAGGGVFTYIVDLADKLVNNYYVYPKFKVLKSGQGKSFENGVEIAGFG